MHASLRANKRRVELPDSFVSISDILNGNHRVGSLVNVVGIVREFLEPIATRGADWKCQIKLCDHSSKDEDEEEDGHISLAVFRPQEEMPDVVLRDVVILFQAKIQKLSSDFLSLVTNHATDIHVYSADKIPPPPSNAFRALKPPTRKVTRKPDQTEHAFISSRFHTVGNSNALSEPKPGAETRQFQSKNPGRKFKELKEVEDRVFADMTVQLVKQPYDSGDIVTIWVSDYTENSQFYNFAFKGLNLDNPYGYNTGVQVVDERGTAWPGPYGRLSLQITVFEPHASAIRKMDAGDWVHFRNVQIKYGSNGANLEGFLREDRNALSRKTNVIPLDPPEDSDSIDPHLKEALRRKRDYERAKKKQLKDLLDAAQAGKKRKSDLAELDNSKLSAKQKRMAKRAQKQRAKSGETKEAHETIRIGAETPNLNPQVKCDHQNKPTSSVEDMLKPISHQTIVEGEELKLTLPFINANYRINARAVNFLPSRLEEFAYPKKQSEYSSLSDYESDSSDSEPEDIRMHINRPHHWEWRFFLELEDAAAPVVAESKDYSLQKQNGEQRNTVWVAVDNQSAQCLLDLDASDLKNNPQNLEALRQRLFLLWGELEEHKTRESEENERKAKSNSPPAHSSDDEGTNRHEKTKSTTTQVINRPFACCIRQYGVKVPESDPGKADAGDGKRWQRMFGLFGIRISG